MAGWLNSDFWHGVITEAAHWAVTTAPTILLILILAFVLLRLVTFGLAQLQLFMLKRGHDSRTSPEEVRKRVLTLTGVVRKSAKIFVWVIVGSLILRQLGLDIAPLVAGAGIAGLALGFGAQNLVRDVISGFFLLLENQVRAGDVAIINGTSGLVESINLRTITLRDSGGIVHIFQNGAINTLSNQTKEWSAMLFEIGVAYKEDPDRVMEVMQDVGEELRHDSAFGPLTLEPLEVWGVEAFTDSAVVIKARLKTLPGEQWKVGREFRRRLKRAFDAHSIELPFRQITLHAGDDAPYQVRLDEPTGRDLAAGASRPEVER